MALKGVGSSLDPFGVTAQTGYFPSSPTPHSGTMPGIDRSAGPSRLTAPSSALSIRNPLTWVGLLAGVTFGLIGFSSTARVGKARARLGIGKE